MLTITKTSRIISIIAWQNLNLLVTKPFVICAEASQSALDFGNTVEELRVNPQNSIRLTSLIPFFQ